MRHCGEMETKLVTTVRLLDFGKFVFQETLGPAVPVNEDDQKPGMYTIPEGNTSVQPTPMRML